MRIRVNTFYQWLLRGPFDYGFAIAMALMALATILWPAYGVWGFYATILHASPDWFALITILCAVAMVEKPGAFRFALASLPVLFYMIFSVIYWLFQANSGDLANGVISVIGSGTIWWCGHWVNARRTRLFTESARNESHT